VTAGKKGAAKAEKKTKSEPVKESVKKTPAPAVSSSAAALNTAVAAQGDLVRKLKTDKAAKPDVEEAVKKLLALKAEFKSATGQDWKPGMTVPDTGKASSPAPTTSSLTPAGINAAITAQGDLVRKLKADKAAKPDVEEAVKKLLALKAEFKTATGNDWKPGMTVPDTGKASSPAPASGSSPVDINAAIVAQGDKVRQLKADKAAKPDVDEAVKKLLGLKAEFKSATGKDWKPGMAVPNTDKASSPASAPATGSSSAADINTAIVGQGDKVRQLKADKAQKPDIDEAVKKLLALKADFKSATGKDWKPGTVVPDSSKASSPAPANNSSGGGELADKIAAQGDLVRTLKTDKKPKEEITAAVNVLLALKAEFKTKTGTDWKPAGGAPAPAKPEKQKKAAKEVKAKEKVETSE